MKKICAILAATLLMGLATTAQAAITTFTSYKDFINATKTTGLLVENFEDTTLIPRLSITEIGGAGTIHDGIYENSVNKQANRYQIFNYAGGMHAFGLWTDLKNTGNPGSGIDLYINDTNTFALNIPNSTPGQFYGFLSDTKFSGVRIQNANGPQAQETYYTVDMAFAPTPTPIPAAAWLLGWGLLGILGLKRRQNVA